MGTRVLSPMRPPSATDVVGNLGGCLPGDEDLSALAAEQAALRRVATLVARGASPEEVFAAVVEEVGRLLPVEYAALGRYEPDDMLHRRRISGGSAGPAFPGGRCRRGEEPRHDRLRDRPFGPDRQLCRCLRAARCRHPRDGLRSAVGAPIIVEGRLWGVHDRGSTQSSRCQPTPRHVSRLHGALGDDDRECREPRRGHPAGRGSGGVAAGGDVGRARGDAGGGVRGGRRGGRAAASRRLRGPEPLRARRDDHLPRRLGHDQRRLPRRYPGDAWREERHHAGRADRSSSANREL